MQHDQWTSCENLECPRKNKYVRIIELSASSRETKTASCSLKVEEHTSQFVGVWKVRFADKSTKYIVVKHNGFKKYLCVY